jgi:hypothetical protein
LKFSFVHFVQHWDVPILDESFDCILLPVELSTPDASQIPYHSTTSLLHPSAPCATVEQWRTGTPAHCAFQNLRQASVGLTTECWEDWLVAPDRLLAEITTS